jgi:anti-anti-sigma factor
MRLVDLQFVVEQGAVVARVAGEIDMSNAADIRVALTEATPNEALGVVLDLTAIEYLDSAGIHLIYRLRERLGARGQSLKLVIPVDSPVHDTLRLAGVQDEIDVVGSLHEGLRAIREADLEHE